MTEFETLQTLLHRRHSCRAFLPQQVPHATIEDIVLAAGRAPSWCNAQPWKLIITSGNETTAFRDQLVQAASGQPDPDYEWPNSYTGVYQERRREVGWQLYNSVGVTKGDREGAARQSARNFVMFDAPHIAIIHAPAELGTYGALDCGGFITAFTLAAEALGIASIPQAAVAGYAGAIRDHFGITDDRKILCAISFGYKDPEHPANSFRTDRAPIEQIADFRGSSN